MGALLEEKGASAKLGLFYEEVRFCRDENEFDLKIWLSNVWEMRFDANMDIKSVADSETLIVLFTQNVMLTISDLLTCVLLPFQAVSKGFDMDIKVIYDEDCDCEETIFSYDDAGLTENITFEGTLLLIREKALSNLSDETCIFNIYCLSHRFAEQSFRLQMLISSSVCRCCF